MKNLICAACPHCSKIEQAVPSDAAVGSCECRHSFICTATPLPFQQSIFCLFWYIITVPGVH